MGFPSVFHGHDTMFGHAKRQVLTSPTEEWLLSQCFCTVCRERATGVDVDRARDRVQSLLEGSFSSPHTDPPALPALVSEYDALDALVSFRADVVSSLLERLSAAAGNVALDGYLMGGFGVDPGEQWPAGVRLDDLDTHLDRVTAICYESDPGAVRTRLEEWTRQLDWIERAFE
jgi:hypothetical protein